MKKATLQSLTYDRLQQSEMSQVKGGGPVIPFRPGYTYCPYCRTWFEGEHDYETCPKRPREEFF